MFFSDGQSKKEGEILSDDIFVIFTRHWFFPKMVKHKYKKIAEILKLIS